MAPVTIYLASLVWSGLPASAQAFLDNIQTKQAPTWLSMDNVQTALNSTAAQGNINNNSAGMTEPGARFNPLTAAIPGGKLALHSAPYGTGTNNLLAPNSVASYGVESNKQAITYESMAIAGQRAQPPAWNSFPSGSYTYGFPTTQPPIPGGIYKGQDAYVPPTSTASVDLNIVDRSGTQYPVPTYNLNYSAAAVNSYIQSKVSSVTASLQSEFSTVAAADLAAGGVQAASDFNAILASVEQLNANSSSSSNSSNSSSSSNASSTGSPIHKRLHSKKAKQTSLTIPGG
jgi:hypothetical protein